MAYDCTVRCETCALDLATDTEEKNRHTETGLCHGVGAGHLSAHPGHTLSYRLERADRAAKRREREAAEEAERHAQAAAESEAHLRERAVRSAHILRPKEHV